MKAASILLLIALLSSSGCGVLDRVQDALVSTGAFTLAPTAVEDATPRCSVEVRASGRRGRGVIVGPTTVLTVAHVVGTEREVEVGAGGFTSVRARVVRTIAAAPESLVELEVVEGFPAERHARLSSGTPAFALCGRGLVRFGRALRPGDSGSPVVDLEGRVVGLVVGVTAQGAGVLARVPVPGERDVALARRP